MKHNRLRNSSPRTASPGNEAAEAQGDGWGWAPDLLTQSAFEQQICAAEGCKISIPGQADRVQIYC